MEMVEVDGRIMALQEQRDHAMNQVVVLRGVIAKLSQELQDFKKGDGDGGASTTSDGVQRPG